MKQMENILKTQTQLEQYRTMLDVLSKSDIQDFSIIILQGSIICESMLNIIIEDKGYSFDRHGLVVSSDGSIHHMSTFLFACRNDDIIPESCQEFVNFIRRIRNQAAHIQNIDYEAAIAFAKAMDYFTIWFHDYLRTHDLIGEQDRRKFEDRLFSLENVLTDQNSKNTISNVRNTIVVDEGSSDANTVELVLLQKLEEQTQLIIKLTSQVSLMQEQNTRIENRVNEIYDQIKELTTQIGAYQSLVERQIEKAVSEEEIDRIIQAYADECIERIINQSQSLTEQHLYEDEKRNLIATLGENAWSKMEESSQTFLVSSKVMYDQLIMLDDIIDYSGVCLLVTKALEVEMDKRFYSKFLNYLDQKYNRDYSKYPTSLLFENRAPLNPEKFTMGNIAFVLCLLDNRHDSLSQKRNNKNRLMEYCKDLLFPGKTDSEINTMINEYAQDVEKIRTSYRNPSAHTNELKKINAEECFNYVLDVEKVLKKMLDSFSF